MKPLTLFIIYAISGATIVSGAVYSVLKIVQMFGGEV